MSDLRSQQGAVEHPGRALLVRGPAGSGKTTVVCQRCAAMVAAGIPVQRMAVLVPSIGRATALRSRLQDLLPGGYEELVVLTPARLAARLLAADGGGAGAGTPVLGPGDRLALLHEHIDELSLRHHDLGGRPVALLAALVRRIDRLKGELIGPERFADWARGLAGDDDPEAAREREFAAVYATHERLLAGAGARDDGGLVADALAAVRRDVRPPPFARLLIDDGHELDLAAASLALALRAEGLTVTGDPDAAVRRYRGAGAERLDAFVERSHAEVVALERSRRCPPAVQRAGAAVSGHSPLPPDRTPEPPAAQSPAVVSLWRCAGERAQVQAVAVEIERLISRKGTAAGAIAVIVPTVTLEGQAIALALQERAIAHRVIGQTAFLERAEVRDALAWLRLLADPTDGPAVVRALARPPIALRSVDIARCTQIARRRKLDIVSALGVALESPQVPPEARDRIRVFLGIHRGCVASLDSIRPDLFVHRLIDRLGLRRHQLLSAQADVVARLRALAALEELAATHCARAPQSTAREFARVVTAVAEVGLGREEEPDLGPMANRGAVQILAAGAAGGLEADHVFVIGLDGRLRAPAPEPIPDALLDEPVPADDDENRERMLRQMLYLACGRARRRLVLAHACVDGRGEPLAPSPLLAEIEAATGAAWEDREEELFGPQEALHDTYRLLRDELLQGTTRAAGRLGDLRLDTDLDVSHAVVRYLELLKVAALIAREEQDSPPSVAEALRDINVRILQAVTAEQREIFQTSPLDDHLLDAERDARARARAVAARDEPSLQAFLPLRGEGVVLSASDIDTYRTCPLKYKFARVLRIPHEPTLHQRFGILIHQVLERHHAGSVADADTAATPSLPQLLGALQDGWRRGGFGDSEEERQLQGKATSALTRYHERFRDEPSEPVWFERPFTFALGPHLVRGRVDRVDRLAGGTYELIDYKTGRPKSAAALADDVQLSLYAVGARESWHLEASRQAYYYLLDDEKVAVPDDGDRDAWVREIATEVAEGIRGQAFEPLPSPGACAWCDYRVACPAAER